MATQGVQLPLGKTLDAPYASFAIHWLPCRKTWNLCWGRAKQSNPQPSPEELLNLVRFIVLVFLPIEAIAIEAGPQEQPERQRWWQETF